MKYFFKKLFTLIMTLLFISVLTFGAFSVISGDAAITKLGTEATPEQIEALREDMGLNKPVTERYIHCARRRRPGRFWRILSIYRSGGI